MEGTAVEKEYSALGNLFQQIINDMKNGTPIWEDFIAKASKLHAVLRSTLTAVSAYLDAFQKIADAATNARGATKDIGTALTRMCLRHKAMETRVKAFTCAIMDCLVNPLQEKLEDWKKTLINIDKDHSREYKRARSELKKRSTDTLRLQKKAKKGKGSDLQRRVETCLQDVNERRQILEDAEKKAVRAALVEERSRFCFFVSLLKPVVDSEVAMLAEMSHLQEGAGQLLRHTSDPHTLPPASEQVISDLQSSCGQWSPPPSPLGGRAPSSSLCSSISSLASSSSGSGSGSAPNTSAPSSGANHTPTPNNLQCHSQAPRLGSVSSRDSGFTSQDTLHLPTLLHLSFKGSDTTSAASSCSTPVGTQEPLGQSVGDTGQCWPHLEDTMQFQRAASAIMSDRPHTISTAYEKGHPRPMLSVHTFQGHGSEAALTGSASQPASPCCAPNSTRPSPASSIYARPPLPTRCSSLERPVVPAKGPPGSMGAVPEHKMAKPSSLPPHLIKDTPQATYVNMFELASMAASRAQHAHASAGGDSAQHQGTHEKACESSTSESSLESSSGYGSQGPCPIEDASQHPNYSDEFALVDIQISNSSRLSVAEWKEGLGELSSQHPPLSISLNSLDETVRSVEEVSTTQAQFATINKTKPCVPKRRPLSMTATCPPSTLRLSLGAGRRGSSGGGGGPGTPLSGAGANKPPPPVRRSSSITRPHHMQHAINEYGSNQHLVQTSCEGDDNLPPPPAFLLHPSEHPQGEGAATSHCSTPVSHVGKGINVAETVKALTELKHTPASPSLLRRNAALQQSQQQQSVTNNAPQSQLSSFQQSKSTFTALQNNANLNPIYGPTGHKIFTYVEQTNTMQNSRNSSFSNLSASSGLYGREPNNSNSSDMYDGTPSGRIVTSSYSATVTYSSSPNTSNYSENSLSTFGQRTQSGCQTPSTPIYGQTTFGKQPNNLNQNLDKKSQYGQSNASGNSIYAQPSQIIAGFNNLGFGGNRNHDGNMSPLAIRKSISNSRSQSADRRGSDFGSSGGLIAAISARLAPQLSPRNSRRSVGGDGDHQTTMGAHFRGSQDSLASSIYGQSPPHKGINSQKSTQPSVAASVQPAFLDKLSATLRQRQASGSPSRACTVRQIINTKAQPDPRVCHGSLMEQIKRGATLKRNKHCNDRSAPKIH